MKYNQSKREKILEYLETLEKPAGLNKIKDVLKVNETVLQKELNELIRSGDIIKLKSGKYSPPGRLNLFTGSIEGNVEGYAFFIPDNKEMDDLFVPRNKLNGAVHGDRVVIRLEKYRGKDEANVVKISERMIKRIVGRVEKAKHFAYVVPFMKKFFYDIYIPNKYAGKLVDGEVVLCEITSYPENRKNPEGIIIKSLGFLNESGVDNNIVMEKYGLKKNFPKSINNFFLNVKENFSEKIEDSTDMTDLFTVTIDGETARDFDDAISITKNDAGFILYIHIADVSNFVRPHNKLDKEAYERGTSVYFPEFAIPMLPEELSNDICSLRPNLKRFTLTVKITYDLDANRKDIAFYQAVIKSDYRLTYNSVNKIIEEKEKTDDKELASLIKNSVELTEKLIKKRKKEGVVDFDLPETEFIFSEDGELVEIKALERKMSHRIIENFMLEANEVVSVFLEDKIDASLFRVHGEPDRKKINEFIDLCRYFGIDIKLPKSITSKEVQKMSNFIMQSSYSYILSSMLVRCMQRALYSTTNIGHFGLASGSYTHFTSPIRRYPDLIIHRLLKKFVFGYKYDITKEWLRSAADHLSDMEQKAESAEREITQFKKMSYIEKNANKIYPGYINRVKPSGLFIFIEDLLLTGFISISKLEDDYYFYNQESNILSGKSKGKKYGVGDVIDVKVDKINYDFLEVDCVIV